jgi:hypothetical protein
MENLKNINGFSSFKFNITAIIGSKEGNDIFEQDLNSIEFKENKEKTFFNLFFKKQIKVDFIYNMNQNFTSIKDIIKDKKRLNFFINKVIAIKAISFDDKEKIELYRLKIKDIIEIKIIPSKLNYIHNERLLYKIKILCEEV